MSQIKNRTIFEGDNLPILRGIDPKCIDLTYLDPPFNSNRKYNTIFRGSGLRNITPQIKAFDDTSERNTESADRVQRVKSVIANPASMKKLNTLSIFIILILLLCRSTGFAQEYTKWHLPEGATYRFGKGIIRDIAYFPDGDKLAVSSSIGIWIYDVNSGEELDLLTDGMHNITQIVFSPDGKTLASANRSNIQLWNTNENKLQDIFTGHTSTITSLVFSPNGKLLASGSVDTTVRLWNIDTGEVVRTLFGHTDTVRSVAFSPNGKTLASVGDTDDKTIQLWEVNSGELQKTVSVDLDRISSSTFSPDGHKFTTGNWDGKIRFWDVSTGQLLETFTGQGRTGTITSLVYSPDGTSLVSGGGGIDRTIRIWDVNTGSVLHTPYTPQLWIWKINIFDFYS